MSVTLQEGVADDDEIKCGSLGKVFGTFGRILSLDL